MPTNPSLLDKIKDEASLLADSFKHNSPITLLNIPDEERLLASVLSNWSLQKSVAILPAQSTDEELDYYKKTIADYKLFHSDDLKNGNSIPFKIDFHSKKFGLIIFTSGSTGYPKAIFLSLHALTKSTEGTIDFFKMNSNDHFLLSLPLHHIGGFMIFYRALLLNATISKVLNKNLPEAICTLGPTFLSLVPMQLQKMLEDNKVTERLKECRAIILGGAPGT